MRAQVSIEFFIFCGIAIIISIAFSLSSISQIKEFNSKKESDAIKDLALKVQREILIASYVEDGYFRQFEIPNDASGYNYTIISLNTSISIDTGNIHYAVGIPLIHGNLTNGTNTINKTGGAIYVNW